MTESHALVFDCLGHTLVGLVDEADAASHRGVIIVVGGPQYRAGSHRQFVLLSRHLASAGITTLRFDHRGIGDSEGHTTFEALEPDIRAAIDAFQERCPAITEIVLWGLCDAASAILMYAPGDKRVAGTVLLNPDVFSEQTQAQSHLSGYYLKRILSVEFWRQLFSGKVRVVSSLLDFLQTVRRARSGRGVSRRRARVPPGKRRVATRNE